MRIDLAAFVRGGGGGLRASGGRGQRAEGRGQRAELPLGFQEGRLPLERVFRLLTGRAFAAAPPLEANQRWDIS